MRLASIQLEHLITFCKIFDSFDSMCKDIIQLYDFYGDETFSILDSVVSGASNEYHAKLFYNKYKNILDLIDKENGISQFFFTIYDIDCYFNEDFRLFYHYIKQNIIHLNDILELLLRMRELGVSKITLDLVNNLKSLRHGMYREFNDNRCINYVGDMEFVSESNGRIIYKSSSGDYILKLKTFEDGFCSNDREIIVSNLLFDKDSLPCVITKDNTYGRIIDEKNKTDNKHNAINNTLEFNEIISELNVVLNRLGKVLDRIDGDNAKYSFVYEELINRIIELENIRDEYEEKIISEYDIEREEIEYQKRLSLK